MGVKRLKIKDEVSYRRGLAARRCEFCEHFVSDFEVRGAKEPRCKVIGLKEGRGYRVNRNSLCDRYEEWQRKDCECPICSGEIQKTRTRWKCRRCGAWWDTDEELARDLQAACG